MHRIPEVDYTDDQILELLNNQDEKGIEVLFKKYYEPLCLSGYRYIRDKQTIEDLVQELFFDLWKKRAGINVKSSLGSYLRTAVRNRALNYIKAQRIDFADEDEIVSFTSEDTNSQEDLETIELETFINGVIDSLPEKCRMVFVLSRHEELSYKEIAEKLDISTKTVENQISKALKILREQLQRYRESQ